MAKGHAKRTTRHKAVRQDGERRKHVPRKRDDVLRAVNRYGGLKGIRGSL